MHCLERLASTGIGQACVQQTLQTKHKRQHQQISPLLSSEVRLCLNCWSLTICSDGEQLVHLDIKSANILLSSDQETAKLADFGLMQIKHAMNVDASVCGKGTKYYIAPEVSLAAALPNHPIAP